MEVPPDAEPISVEELKRSGPLGASKGRDQQAAARVRAFAKINLSLRVARRSRRTAIHELRTVFQSIALHDTLTIRARTRRRFD